MKSSAAAAQAAAGKGMPTPAQDYTIHVLAPHQFEDGSVHGPYHHYCKPISSEVLQCLLFESADANALLTDIEHFVAKPIARANVLLETWNKYYHDHEVEIASGRVQVLDMPEARPKKSRPLQRRPTASSSISGQKGRRLRLAR